MFAVCARSLCRPYGNRLASLSNLYAAVGTFLAPVITCGDADSLTMIRYEPHRKKGELTMRLDVMLLITAILVALAVWTEVDKWRKRKSRQ